MHLYLATQSALGDVVGSSGQFMERTSQRACQKDAQKECRYCGPGSSPDEQAIDSFQEGRPGRSYCGRPMHP